MQVPRLQRRQRHRRLLGLGRGDALLDPPAQPAPLALEQLGDEAAHLLALGLADAADLERPLERGA